MQVCLRDGKSLEIGQPEEMLEVEASELFGSRKLIGHPL